MKSVICFGLIMCALAPPIQGQQYNYLLEALDSAMLMKGNFDYQSESYRYYLTYEAAAMSEMLTDRITAAIATATTVEQGTAIRYCAVQAGYYPVAIVGATAGHLEDLQNAAVEFHQKVIDELMATNVFTVNWEVFFYYFSVRLNAAYANLNDVLLQNVIDSLVEVISTSNIVFTELDDCLNAI